MIDTNPTAPEILSLDDVELNARVAAIVAAGHTTGPYVSDLVARMIRAFDADDPACVVLLDELHALVGPPPGSPERWH